MLTNKISSFIHQFHQFKNGDKRWATGSLVYTGGGLIVLFFWLLMGDFIWSLKERSITPIVQLLFKTHEASDFTIGIFMGALPTIIGLLIGPVISYQSDRLRGPWGRRIPYLFLTTPPVAVSMILLGFSPKFGHLLHQALGAYSPGEHMLVLAFIGFFWAVFEFGTIIANAIFVGLINDVVPEAFLGRFFGMFRIVSLTSGIGFNFWIMGKAQEYSLLIFIVTGILYGGGFLLMCMNVKEGTYPPVENEVPVSTNHRFLSACRIYFKECFSHSYYIWLFITKALMAMAGTPLGLFILVYANSIGVSMDSYGKCLAATYVCSLFLSYPIGALVDRFHPLRVTLAVVFVNAIFCFVATFVLVRNDAFIVILFISGVIGGCFLTGSAALAQRLFPRDKFTQFASALGVIMAIPSIFFGPALGKLLDMLGHQYRYIFLVSGVISVLSLIAGFVVYRKFVQYGGPKNYVAP